jgi:hypothetical protein
MSGSLTIRAQPFLVEERTSLWRGVVEFNPPVHSGPVCVTFSGRGTGPFWGAAGIGAMRFLIMEPSS